MTQVMSLAAALDRVAMLQQMLSPAPVVTATAAQPTTFNSALTSATATPTATGPVALASTATGGTPAGRPRWPPPRPRSAQAEQPPGSNDSPRIAQYRQATAGVRRRPVVRVLRLLGRPPGRRAARRRRPGLRPRRRRVGLGRSAPAARPAGRPQPGRPDRLGRAHRHRRVRRRRRLDHTVEGNSSDPVSTPQLRAGPRRRAWASCESGSSLA